MMQMIRHHHTSEQLVISGFLLHIDVASAQYKPSLPTQ